jgi:hypothetical protein
MLLPYNDTNGNIEFQKKQLLTAILQAKQDREYTGSFTFPNGLLC